MNFAVSAKSMAEIAKDEPFKAKDQKRTARAEPYRAENEKRTEDSNGVRELRRVFSTFDKNGDGLISKEEMKDSLRMLGLQMEDDDFSLAISNADSNGDGFVDFREFSILYESLRASELGDNGSADNEEDLRDAFRVFDENGDGLISVEELQAILASLGLREGRALSACRDMISSIDADGDGMVNFAEFKHMMYKKNSCSLPKPSP